MRAAPICLRRNDRDAVGSRTEAVMYKPERIWDIDSKMLTIGLVYAIALLASIAHVSGIF